MPPGGHLIFYLKKPKLMRIVPSTKLTATFALFLFSLALSLPLFSQEAAARPAQQLRNEKRLPMQKWEFRAGLGLTPTFASDRVQTLVPPHLVEVRARLHSSFSMAFMAGRSVSSAKRATVGQPNTFTEYQNDFTALGLRLAVHSSYRQKLEAYGGMTLGYGIANVKEIREPGIVVDPRGGPSFTPKGAQPRSGMFVTAFVGANYKLGRRLGVFGELGFGIAVASAGISYRM
jgi:hypothetical protein